MAVSFLFRQVVLESRARSCHGFLFFYYILLHELLGHTVVLPIKDLVFEMLDGLEALFLILEKITLNFLVKINKSVFICVMLVLDLLKHLIVHFGYLFLKFGVRDD